MRKGDKLYYVDAKSVYEILDVTTVNDDEYIKNGEYVVIIRDGADRLTTKTGIVNTNDIDNGKPNCRWFTSEIKAKNGNLIFKEWAMERKTELGL